MDTNVSVEHAASFLRVESEEEEEEEKEEEIYCFRRFGICFQAMSSQPRNT